MESIPFFHWGSLPIPSYILLAYWSPRSSQTVAISWDIANRLPDAVKPCRMMQKVGGLVGRAPMCNFYKLVKALLTLTTICNVARGLVYRSHFWKPCSVGKHCKPDKFGKYCCSLLIVIVFSYVLMTCHLEGCLAKRQHINSRT